MLELKRFFRPSLKRNQSSQVNLNKNDASASTLSLSKHDPFDEDGTLVQKYGRMGKILGSGAGGSVRLLVRASDGVTFAVKEFRPRRPNEQEKEYAKKCTAEFCIGSTLHHPNIIQTLDIINENSHYYEVMEYCPVDFFAVVMSGKMLRGEINCCFRQICEGVKYLHSMGIAHRDLKLDNCVINKEGIVKIIDFGSAVVFRYPYEDQIVKAHGVCGSDPYLAPEVLTQQRYNPQPVDVWSIAIIYCCMTLKRFPWKAPKQSDPSFKFYAMPDDQVHDYYQAAAAHKELLRRRKEERKRREVDVEKITEVLDNAHIDQPIEPSKPETEQKKTNSKESRKITPQTSKNNSDERVNQKSPKQQEHQPQSQPQPQSQHQPQHHQQIHGPYRLMRLLPHAARPIMSRMLEVDATKRATFDDVFKDEWFTEIISCTVDPKGHTIHVPGHVHTEVREEDAHLESYKEKESKK
jgi:serine/threonine protein kinase